MNTMLARATAMALTAATVAAAPAQAQIFYYPPTFAGGPITGADPNAGLPLPKATPAEQDANLLWNLRGALNVAALTCQNWPGLLIVPNYNDILVHHNGELANAYAALNKYFLRMNKAAGAKKFYEFSTVTYNQFSKTRDPRGFCQTAGNVAKEALSVRKGQLMSVARARMLEIRNSLAGYRDPFMPGTDFRRLVANMPSMDPRCWKKGRYDAGRCGYLS